jgi:hypothetical protein
MDEWLYTIAAQLRHLIPEQVVVLMGDVVSGLDEKQRTRLPD